MKIVFTGGGTAGHIYPIIAIIKEIKKNNPNVSFYYIGPKDDFALTALQEENVIIKIISAGKIRRYLSFQNIIDILYRIPKGFFQSFYYIYTINPDLIFSKGGYGSITPVIASWILQTPIFLHESDSIPGLANRVNGKLALVIFLAFGIKQISFFSPNKLMVVGNPIRSEILQGNLDEAKRIFSLSGEKPVILILGGSQGAQIINETILLMMPDFLEKFEVIHQTGEKNIKEIEKESKTVIPENLQKYYHALGFLDKNKLKHAYKASDLIIARAGAGTIFEIAEIEKPSILIPLKGSAQNHQVKNAYAFAQDGKSIVIEQENLKAHFLLEKIKYLFSQRSIMEEMKKKCRNFAKPNAAKIIAEYIISYLEQ
ncbi:MAG: undecaprenyldiphospho-muramoylpentapeptide beta-N-acetylglucosaminyltransferase [Candidatus Pacebacteria bacterium]|nr:undecaprenyldiphospho-muramoylpentapeptide beta-N-acetylglucosaminyltransferase [Candidatus Paceibacterota bacterium]